MTPNTKSASEPQTAIPVPGFAQVVALPVEVRDQLLAFFTDQSEISQRAALGMSEVARVLRNLPPLEQ